MSETEPELTFTPEEQTLVEAAQAYFVAIGACIEAGGDAQKAIVQAMPAELRESMPMLVAMAGI